MCGGTHYYAHWNSTISGLSPRVRGNRKLHRLDNPVGRSIPACAGEPAHFTDDGCVGKVYPRVCGGTGQGSIPACAGEPFERLAGVVARVVYPRVCGGTRARSIDGAAASGLSPRVRGNRIGVIAAPPDPGSIPACAGEPW